MNNDNSDDSDVEYEVITNDNQSFLLRKNVIVQIHVLKDLFRNTGVKSVNVPLVGSDMFKIMVKFAKFHLDEPPYLALEYGPHTLHYRDYKFLKEYETQFDELLVATDFLYFPHLMDTILLYIREYFIYGHNTLSLAHSLGLEPRYVEEKEKDE